MPVTQITDHAARAYKRLAQQFKRDPLISGVVRTIGDRAQQLENAAWDVLVSRDVETATGERLDLLGRFVGQARGAASDADYRFRIKARVRANRSKGRVEDLIAVFRLLFSGVIRIVPAFPASLIMHFEGGTLQPVNSPLYLEFLRLAKAGGVNAFLHYSLVPAADTFAFSLSALSDVLYSGDEVIPVSVDLSNWPTSGSLIISPGAPEEETIAYTSRTGNVFSLAGPLVNDHPTTDDLFLVVLAGSFTGKGWGDSTDATVGGKFSSIEQA